MSDWLGMSARPVEPSPELRARVLERALWRRRPRWMLAAAASAVLALGAGGYWAARTAARLEAVSAERADLAARVAALQDTLSLLRGPGSRVVQIPVRTGGRDGYVTVFADSLTRRWLVSCHGLAPNEPDQTYQLWFITESGMKTAALMPMDHDAPMVMALEIPTEGGHVMGVAMSIEPRVGSAEPTGLMVFHVHL